MWKLIVGNPLVAAIIFAVIFSMGASSAYYLKSLQADKEISALKLKTSNEHLDLSNQLVAAQEKARAGEQQANKDQVENQKKWQDRNVKLEKQHESDQVALEKLKKNGGGNALSRDAVLAWLHDNPESTTGAIDVPAAPGDSADPASRPAACTESDLLADRNNWKQAFGYCATDLTLCKDTLKTWHKQINGN